MAILAFTSAVSERIDVALAVGIPFPYFQKENTGGCLSWHRGLEEI